MHGQRNLKKRILPGHVTYMGKRRGTYRVVVGKPEGKRSFVRPSIQGRITLK